MLMLCYDANALQMRLILSKAVDHQILHDICEGKE